MNGISAATLVLALVGSRAQATLADLGLTVTLPRLAGVEERSGAPGDQVRAVWKGALEGTQVEIVLRTFPLEQWGFREPGGVTVVVVDWLRERGELDVDGAFEHQGKYGFAPLLSVVTGPLRSGDEVAGRAWLASGLLPAHGYTFHVTAQPEPDEAARRQLLDFFAKGIAYAGPERDPQWTVDEVVARWRKDAPDDLQAEFERNLSKKAWVKNALLRTEHYLVMTNASGGKKFADQMEANYEEIARIYPLPSGKGCRLMPVFLFRDPDDYYAFCVKRGMTLEAAKKSKGHASGDYYATWYESPTDPTHIHEQTHQIFGNRLFLTGGGSWFQEGVAEYVESSKNERNVIASQVVKGRHLPLAELFARKSLLWSSETDRKEGGSEAADLYNQAGLFIEFLRESKWAKEEFPRFLETVGRLPRGNAGKVCAALEELYGVGLEGLEAEFQRYCADR